MGKLYGIGVGPGDPELLTLKAYKILQKADVIFCPEKKKGAGSFAFDIIKEHIKDSKARIVDLEYPMHYHGDELKKMWQENGRIISEYLKGEKTGAFITLGDPSVYSTFMDTLPYIEAFGTVFLCSSSYFQNASYSLGRGPACGTGTEKQPRRPDKAS